MKYKKIWKQDGQEEIITWPEVKKLIEKEYNNSKEVIELVKKGHGVDFNFSYIEPIR